MALRGYYLGCPGWAVKSWVGRFYPEGTKPGELLARYSRVFNAVEGNTTFYALPPADKVAQWREQVPDDFRFCFKFPREVTHDKLLVDCAVEVRTFLDRIAPLEHLIGTLMIQLPPRFDATQLPRLRAFLGRLPRAYHYAVEYRHLDFFQGGPEEDDAMALLRERGVDLAMMDARGLHETKSLALADVRARKPDLPVIVRATAQQPIVRFVPHESWAAGERFAAPWAAHVARWIAQGRRPYFFVHSPDDAFAPENAYAFHALLRAQADVGELPPWPGGERQLSLI
ncbi:MAG TPA: DUF72 domain-containing protein [Kofleriaceae bacterium]|jgi:uncharacterized protein YecE (DUF72 family)